MLFRAKSEWCKPKKVKKLALNSQLLIVQILTNNVQLRLSYSITTVQMAARKNIYFIILEMTGLNLKAYFIVCQTVA